MSNIKNQRIASELLRHTTTIIANNIGHQALKNITITHVVVSKDLSHAKIYFTHPDQASQDLVTKELNNASGFIRRELANTMNLRHTPELNFKYDSSINYGHKIERILKELNNYDH